MTVGVRGYIVFGWEDSFRTEATTRDKVFGRQQRISTLSLSNDIEAVYELGNRFAKALQEKTLTGSWGVDCVLASPWWLKALLPTVTTVDNGDGTYTHSFTVGDSQPPSMTIEVGERGESSDVVRKLLGCFVGSATVSAEAGGLVAVRLSGSYADESLGSSLATAIVDADEPFVFADGTLELPSGTTLSKVRSVEVSISPNAEAIFELGTRKATGFVTKQYDITGRMTVLLQDSSMIEYFYGGSGATTPQNSVDELASMVLTFNNGKTGTDAREIKLSLAGVKFNTIDNAFGPEDTIFLDIEFMAREVSAEATNTTATPL